MKRTTLFSLAALAGVSLSFAQTTITVDADHRHQTIDGFGSSINGWTAPLYYLYYSDDFARFAVEDLGMTVFRLEMWGGISLAPIEDWRDISYEDFKWKGEGARGKVNVDWAKRITEINPEVKIIGTIWSPPAWMKENNSRSGTKSGYLLDNRRNYDDNNRLREDRYQHFAKWVVEWARYMESQGTPFYAISLQNELMFTQWFESVLYTPEEYARLVKVTGEMFEAEGVKKPLFFGPEDMTQANYSNEVRHRPYVDALMQPDVKKYFDAFATHGYSDGVNEDDRNSAEAYWNGIKQFGLPYWITEGGSGEHEWPRPLIDGIAPRLHAALAKGNVSLFTGWQLTDEPHISSHHEFMRYDQPTKKTYATMHFWRHIRPGSVRVEASYPNKNDDLQVSAYIHEERGERVVIVINRTEDPQEVLIEWDDGKQDQVWKAWQTTEHLSHEELAVPTREGSPHLILPGLSITTLTASAP